MSLPNQPLKTLLRFILPLFIMLFGINCLMATEYAERTEPSDLTSYLLEEMEVNSSTLELLEDKMNKEGDPFAKKNKKKKKKANINCSKAPRTKNRCKLYRHAMSKKNVKRTYQSVFSSTKSRYNLLKGQKKRNKKNESQNNGRKEKKSLL